jgi:hypothetical protein
LPNIDVCLSVISFSRNLIFSTICITVNILSVAVMVQTVGAKLQSDRQ